MALSGGSPRRHRNTYRFAATAVLGLVAAACASDLPVQPEQQPGHELLANRSAASCTNVQGTLVGSVFGASPLTGDLEGQVWAYREPIAVPRGQAVHLQTFHVFDLGNGDTFMTEDSGVQAPVAPPVYRLNNRYTIVGGTGAYANGSGFLHVHGTLIIDFTGQDPRNGEIDARYRGRVCS